MLKSISIILALFFCTLLQAQPNSYFTIRTEHQFNDVQEKLAKDPNNAALLWKRISILQSDYSEYEERTTRKLFNFEKYSPQEQIKDLTYLIENVKELIVEYDTLTPFNFLQTRANIYAKLEDSANVDADNAAMLIYLQEHTEQLNYNTASTINSNIVNYYSELAALAENEDIKKEYYTKALHYVDFICPIEQAKFFDEKNEIMLAEMTEMSMFKANILLELGETHRLINYYKKLIIFSADYLNILAHPDSIYTKMSIIDNTKQYGFQIGNIYYQNQDYKNAQLWLQAYLQDLEDIESQDFYPESNLQIAQQLLINILIKEENKDLKKQLEAIKPLAENILQTPYESLDQLDFYLVKMSHKHPKVGDIYLFRALMKFKNRTYHYADYQTYGKEILFLLDKAKSLNSDHIHKDFVLGVVHIELQNNKELGEFYLKQALKAKPNYYDNYIYENYLDFPRQEPTDLEQDYSDFTDDLDYSLLVKTPTNIIKMAKSK